VSNPRVTPYGDRGVLLELAEPDDPAEAADEVAGWVAAVETAAIPGVIDLVPAARSVLVHLAAGVAPQQIQLLVAALQPVRREPGGSAEPVVIPVVYDGPDLAEVAQLSGLTAAEVVAAHCASLWRVAFAGFAPGFGYLVGGDPRLAVPRRTSPRTRVPEGAVAVAAGYSAVYPRSSPGGWQLIGRTELAMWDVTRDPPALLRPGGRVRFAETGR
jgi:KipI family sensor histidine kinase inhibitor